MVSGEASGIEKMEEQMIMGGQTMDLASRLLGGLVLVSTRANEGDGSTRTLVLARRSQPMMLSIGKKSDSDCQKEVSFP